VTFVGRSLVFVTLVVAVVLFLNPACSLALGTQTEDPEKLWNSPTTSTLYSVFMVSSNDGWAVGENGATIHWDGASWSDFESPTNHTLRSVYMINSFEGWAMGEGGTIIRWDGATWNIIESPVAERLNSISMTTSSNGWAVGEGQVAIHWNGYVWEKEASNIQLPAPYTGGTVDLKSVCMLSSNEIWVCGISSPYPMGSGLYVSPIWVFKFSSTGEWQIMKAIELTCDRASIQFLSPNDGWLVGTGQGFKGYLHGLAAHWNGNEWDSETHFGRTSPFDPPNVGNWQFYPNSVFMLDSNDIFAVGDHGSWVGPNILRHRGTSWNNITSPIDVLLYSVFMVNGNDGWAVGSNGTIIRWNGTEWILEFPSFLILPLFIIATLLVALIYRRKHAGLSRKWCKVVISLIFGFGGRFCARNARYHYSRAMHPSTFSIL